jgi:ElaB/YqjD/DUF883 family membrane-anchored ribosome-binding protein
MMSTATTRPQNEADKLKSAANQAGQAALDAANTVGNRTQDFMHNVGQKAQEIAQTAGQKAQDFARTAEKKAEEFAHTADENATNVVGGGLKTAAGKVREKLPHEGVLGQASEAVAGALERGGSYLEEKHLRGMADDFTEVIKKNPIPSVLIAVGLGYLLGRTLRS